MDQTAGKGARVRNPSDGRTIIFDLPTTGYKDIKFTYAVQRTNEGMLNNHLSYSTNGMNYTQNGLAQGAFPIATDYGLVAVDFTSITAVNNNANFKIQIAFEGNTTADNGNNRFDNVTLKGIENNLSTTSHQSTAYQVFPNPFTDNVQIISSEKMAEWSVHDIVGKKIIQKTMANTNSETIDLSVLNTGVYLLKIKTAAGLITHKLIKR